MESQRSAERRPLPLYGVSLVIVTLLALSGIGIGGGTLAGLLYSEHSPLFGFREFGYRGEIVLSIVLDVATVVLLAAFLVLRAPRGSYHPRERIA